MLALLRRLFDVDAARAETAHYKSLYEAAFCALEAAEGKIEVERRRNTRREDDLVNSIIALANRESRAIYPVPRDAGPVENAVEPPQTSEDAEFENAVKLRISHFVEDGRSKGRTYDQDELILLEEAIRKNPDHYFQ